MNFKTFANYLPLSEVQKGLRNEDIVEGVLRINPRNYLDAYISAPEGGLDIYVGGMTDRNRAFNGDKVAVHLNEPKDWKILFDIIRVNFDEWEQHFQTILSTKSTRSNPIERRSQMSGNICEGIDKSHQNSETKCVDKCIDNNVFKTEEMCEALEQSVDSNRKKNKRRHRSRKSKTKVEDSVKTVEFDKTSVLRPEVIESLTTNKGNKCYKMVKTGDKLNEKMKEIRTLKVEDLLDLEFCGKCVQRTGKVVAITEAIHSRISGGRLTHMKEMNQNWALFIPNDSRIPRMRIRMSDCPPDFIPNPHHYSQTLFIAKLYEWKTTDHFASGHLIKNLGNAGDIEAETELILVEHQIDFNDFPKEVFYALPNVVDDESWAIPLKELEDRRDLRNECVFTIDPKTARDLDDALSIKILSDDLFEVGVHIADVSYFLREGMPLDDIARQRTTSVYLVQKVIPMLPRILCEKLCSLNSGEEKLTFSVIWVLDKNANIIEEWFGRTVIKSCIKLSYELAQDMIDDPNRKWSDNELPAISDQWSYRDISERVNLLNGIAGKLRKDRFERGSLRIDKLQLQFVLDEDTKLPSGFSPYIFRDSNRLVEEFMLLANMAVAHRIYGMFKDKAFLRCHPPPEEEALNDFKSFCRRNGFVVDTTTSQSLQRSLNGIINNDENTSKVVANYLLKTMQMAQYVCVGMRSAAQDLHHYALNVPLYTHFTSPIRRYADVIVHRLLSASLSYREVISDSVQDLHRLAKRCNDKKLSARLVHESSARLFLNTYIKQIGKIETKSIVVQVLDKSFDVLVLNCGVICRIYLDPLPIKRFEFQTKQGKNELILEWENSSDSQQTLRQTISVCLEVRVQLSVNEDDSTKFNAILQHPNGLFDHKPIKRNANK